MSHHVTAFFHQTRREVPWPWWWLLVVGCVGKSQHLERYRLLSCADGPIILFKRDQNQSQTIIISHKESFSNADFQQPFNGDMQCVWQCLTPLDLALFCNLWIGMIPRGLSAHATLEKLYVWGFPWTSDLRDLRHHYLICSRLGETSMHVYSTDWNILKKTTAWTFSSGPDSQTCCTPFEVSLHKSCDSFGSMHLQVNAKFAFTGPLRSAGLRQTRFPSTWWLVTVRKLQAMSMMLYKC